MKANGFVEKFGWLLSKAFVENWSDLAIHYGFDIADLKRLVESWELVQEYGGLENSKIEVKKRPSQLLLKQAIADVESCNE